MNESSRDGVRFYPTWTIDCAQCGIVGQAPQNDVHMSAVNHFANVHPLQNPVPGSAYTAYPSPTRCDTCNIAVEEGEDWWTHVSRPPTSVGLSVDADGRWLACPECHELYEARDVEGWVRRKVAVALVQTRLLQTQPAMLHVLEDDARIRFTILLQRWDAGVRIATTS